MSGLDVAVLLAIAYALTNGLHDAANSIATLVATRAARPGPAVLLAAVGNVLGPVLFGAAVADVVAGIVQVPPTETVAVIGAALTSAVAWNLVTWRIGIPSSSGHALVGGLAGAAIATGGLDAVNWGPLDGWKPSGVGGALLALAIAPVAGFAAGWLLERALRRVLARATDGVGGPVRATQWVLSGVVAFGHGANDGQKAVGLIAALLLATGRISSLDAPTWAALACGTALTLGTALGGWPIVRTVGRRIFRLRPADSVASQGGSAAVLDRGGGTGEHHADRRVVGRGRRIGTGTVAPRPLAGRARDPRRLARYAAGVRPARGGRGRAVEVGDVRRRWFLPETPDVLGMLGTQLDTTLAAMRAFARWAHGDLDAADEVRALEHRADDQKRALWRALRTAFVTPVDAEDLFVMSAELDEVLNGTKDVVREADVWSMRPDATIADIADLLVTGVERLGDAFACLGAPGDDATEAADAAVKSQRSVERAYREGMSTLLERPDPQEVLGRRELYARLVEVSGRLAQVAERVWYAVVKEA